MCAGNVSGTATKLREQKRVVCRWETDTKLKAGVRLSSCHAALVVVQNSYIVCAGSAGAVKKQRLLRDDGVRCLLKMSTRLSCGPEYGFQAPLGAAHG